MDATNEECVYHTLPLVTPYAALAPAQQKQNPTGFVSASAE